MMPFVDTKILSKVKLLSRSNANSEVLKGQADVIQKRVISVQDAQDLIHTFATDYTSFPFVLLPHITLDSFRRERPFLLLAALTIASRKQFKLQESLEREFREVLRYVRLGVNASCLVAECGHIHPGEAESFTIPG